MSLANDISSKNTLVDKADVQHTLSLGGAGVRAHMPPRRGGGICSQTDFMFHLSCRPDPDEQLAACLRVNEVLFCLGRGVRRSTKRREVFAEPVRRSALSGVADGLVRSAVPARGRQAAEKETTKSRALPMLNMFPHRRQPTATAVDRKSSRGTRPRRSTTDEKICALLRGTSRRP